MKCMHFFPLLTSASPIRTALVDNLHSEVMKSVSKIEELKNNPAPRLLCRGIIAVSSCMPC